MKTTLCVYGRCPKCQKIHFQPAHSVIDETDLKSKCDCGGTIVWDEMIQHNIPRHTMRSERRGWKRWIAGVSPVAGYESCMLFFTIILLALVGDYITLDAGGWTTTWRWVYIGSAVVITVTVWLIERSVMSRLTNNLRCSAFEDGYRQGRYLERSEMEKNERP